MSEPIISVLIPVYNSSEFLKESIATVLNQTFKDIELVVVDDGSTDNSLEILEDFAKSDNRIKIFTKENGGSASARNMALKNALGKYISFFDPDDYISSNLLELAYNSMINNDSEIVMFKADAFYGDKNIIDKSFFRLDRDFNLENYDNFTFNYKDIKHWVLNRDFAPWAKLYKKEFLDSYDDFVFDEGVSFEDVPFHIKAMLRAEKISFVNEFLYHWRSNNPKSVTKTPNFCYDIFRIMDIIYEFLNQEGIYEEFELEYKIFELAHGYAYILKVNSDDYFNMAKERIEDMGLEFIKNMPSNSREKYEVLSSSDNLEEFKINNSLIPYKQKIKSLNDELTKFKKDNSKIKSDLNKLKKENKKLKNELDKSQKLNKEILSSSSWKITEPLRKIKNVKK